MSSIKMPTIGIFKRNRCSSSRTLSSGWQYFYTKIGKDERILIPKLTLALLQAEKSNLTGYVIEVTLEPA